MAVRLLKDVLREKLEKLSQVNYPEGVNSSYCKTQTNSVITFTRHGVIRTEVTHEIDF